MNTKILETLEFNKIKTLFEPHLLTEQGLEELKGLAPTCLLYTSTFHALSSTKNLVKKLFIKMQ